MTLDSSEGSTTNPPDPNSIKCHAKCQIEIVSSELTSQLVIFHQLNTFMDIFSVLFQHQESVKESSLSVTNRPPPPRAAGHNDNFFDTFLFEIIYRILF